MPLFADLVAVSDRVAATPSRLAKLRELAAFLRQLHGDDVQIGALFLSGEVRQGKIGVGYTVHAYTQLDAAASPSLTLADVDAALEALVNLRGKGSTAARKQLLEDLFSRATAAEQSFLARLLVSELRQGALAALMVEAIAEAADVPVSDVRRAAMYAPNAGVLAAAALSGDGDALAGFQIEVLAPIAPMLAQTATDTAEALERLGGTAAFEWKVDGARVQVHKQGEIVRVFTRSLNDVSTAVPEVISAVATIDARSIVLDGETVALDERGRPRPFQITMRRFGRKLDVDSLRRELPLHVYFFDCLSLDGRNLADRPASERFRAMSEALPADLLIPRIITSLQDEAQRFYDDAMAHGHEGVMAKALDSVYEAGSRGASWLKIKHVHTLDLVVLAAEWGSGRRKGKLSNLHLGARDPVNGGFVMLGKTFKGLTDAMLEWQTQEFLARESGRDSYTVYVRPEIVVEVAFNDIQTSPHYPGGVALRFARVKAYRTDKSAQDANTIDDVRAIHAKQAGRD
ncbi:MAG TPA: ATP-dependent DNA ligase [Povalibacter sp.]|nr:ATP-dependent DNA ligase [Povalibacter sp.]